MEFGTGSGVILVYLSKKYPNSNIIGIEKKYRISGISKKKLIRK